MKKLLARFNTEWSAATVGDADVLLYSVSW